MCVSEKTCFLVYNLTAATILVTIMCLVAMGAFIISCTNTERLSPEKIPIELNDEVRAKIAGLGFDVSDLQIVTPEDDLQGKGEPSFLVEGDIILTREALNDLLSGKYVKALTDEEQAYTCTTGIVTGTPTTISVIGFTGPGYTLSTKMQDALTEAIASYNGLGLDLTFSLTFENSEDADIIVYSPPGGAGGVAGFP